MVEIGASRRSRRRNNSAAVEGLADLAAHPPAWSAHRMGRIDRDDLADDEPVEQYADCGEALLYDRLLKILAKRTHIGRDMQRFGRDELRLNSPEPGCREHAPVAPDDHDLEFGWRAGEDARG